jgi:hypothetical protein
MTEFQWSVLLTVVSVPLSALASWFFSRMYYLKSLKNSDTEATKEREALMEALKGNNAKDEAFTMQQHIDAAVDAWRKRGTAVPYVDSLTGVSREQKAQILRSASLRHKGREPKRNPYLSGPQ